jgi:hypothetical protein
VQLLNLKTGIDFGAEGNLREFDPVGFSATSDSVSTWSEAGTAALSFRLAPTRADLAFTIELFPYLADGRIAQQGCWVFCNGLFVHYEGVRAPIEMRFTVPREGLNPRANRLSFALPDATSPKALKLGDDLRLLGLSFVKLTAGAAAANG